MTRLAQKMIYLSLKRQKTFLKEENAWIAKDL